MSARYEPSSSNATGSATAGRYPIKEMNQQERIINQLKNELMKKTKEYEAVCKDKDDALAAMQAQVIYMMNDVERAKEDSLSMIEERKVMMCEIDRLSDLVQELNERYGEMKRAAAHSDAKSSREIISLQQDVTNMKESLINAMQENLQLRLQSDSFEQKLMNAREQIQNLNELVARISEESICTATTTDSDAKLEKDNSQATSSSIKRYIENGLLVGTIVLPVLANAMSHMNISVRPKL